MNIEINTELGKLVVEEASLNPDDWIVIKSQSKVFDKESFIVSEFIKDYPGFTPLGSNDSEKFKFITELCGRQPALRAWYAASSVKYSDTTQLPLYLDKCVDPEEYAIIQDNLLRMKDELAVVVKARNDLAAKYNSDLEALRKREADIISKSTGGNNAMKIVNLTTEALPLSIQMKIQSFDVKTGDLDIADSRRRLAQEYLAKFKIALFEFVKDNPTVDLDSLINSIQLK